MTRLTRREFSGMAVTAVAAPFGQSAGAPARGPLTAQALLDRIKTTIGVAWKTDSVDGFAAGDPATTVAGIVTTALPTIAVLRRAVAAGANVVIAAQPAFYARTDARRPSPGPTASPGTAPPVPTPIVDPVVAAKRDYVDRHGLVVMRLSDHWRARESDPMAAAFGAAMGWSRHQAAGDPRRYDVPAMTLETLVAAVGRALGTDGGIRVVGEPSMRLRTIGLLPGSTPIQAALAMLPTVDAIVAGEVREWETVEYVRDQVASGAAKALVLVGRVVSEEPAMNACAEWLKTVAPGVAVTHVPAGDPYWRPAP
jgi:putative NIF3 family GTP cyclohydrolase 1 type 2